MNFRFEGCVVVLCFATLYSPYSGAPIFLFIHILPQPDQSWSLCISWLSFTSVGFGLECLGLGDSGIIRMIGLQAPKTA